MKFLRIFLGYVKWHYTRAVISLFITWKNLARFLFEYFSIKSLLLNFFSPWKRKIDAYKKGSGLDKLFESIIINVIMRIVGMIVRSIVILIGFVVWATFILIFPIALIVWLVIFPTLLFIALYGITIFFSIK
jgi:hypothetical protein